MEIVGTPTNEKTREKIARAETLSIRLRVSMAQDGATDKVLPMVDELTNLFRDINRDIRYLVKVSKTAH